MQDETKNTNDKHNFGMWLIEEYGIEYLHELYIYLAQIILIQILQKSIDLDKYY